MWHDGIGWGTGFGVVFCVLFWGILIGLVTWAIYRFSRRDSSVSKVNHIEIAKERYAKGDLSKEDFEQLKKDLS